MGYQRGDRFGGDRWRDRDDYREEGRYRAEQGCYGRDRGGDWGRDRDRAPDRERGWRDDDDRGFFERAGDEIRSWFSDDDDYRDRNRFREGAERERDRGPRYWRGGPNYGGDYDAGRRFDRVDAGSTGTHAADPVSAPVGGGYAPDYGYGPSGVSSAREYYASRRGGDRHDPHYHEWRSRQIQSLDRDYDDYRREHQSQFEQEFGSWRDKRQGQRQSLGRVAPHMEVVGSDNEHLGTVDKVRGDRIILTKSDPNAGGHHHSIPCGWIDKVEDTVVLAKTAAQAQKQWEDEDTNRALFEGEDRGSDGPHALDRAFKGTY